MTTDQRHDPADRRPSRRGLLTAGAAGAVAFVAACTRDDQWGLGEPVASESASATTLPLSAAAATLGQGTFRLFTDEEMNFQTLFGLGEAGQITVTGEVVAAVAQANAADGGASYQSLYDALVAQGNRLQEKAIESRSKGHRHSARSQFLRSARYYSMALYWVLGTSTPDAEAATYSAMDASFRSALELFETPPASFEVDYGGTTPMPVWFFPGAAGRDLPTIIINNGSDGQAVDLLAQGGFEALERGHNVVIFEGPGQGSQLFLHNIVFRHDWEAVISPLLDELERRSDVDRSNFVLRGISFGGLLAPRAAAFEPRVAGLIADPGSTSTWLDYPKIVRDTANGTPAEVNQNWKEMILPGSTPPQLFELKKSLEIFTPEAHEQVMAGKPPADWYAISTAVKKFDLSGVAERITCPTLVTMYEGDTAFTDEPRKLYDMLTGAEDKELVTFTSVDGAQYHCGPMAPQVANEVMWDWVQDRFDRGRGGGGPTPPRLRCRRGALRACRRIGADIGHERQRELVAGHGSPVQVALPVVAAQVDEGARLHVPLDSFGDCRQPEGLRKRHHVLCDRALAGTERVDEHLVDLDGRDRQPLHLSQGRVPGSEVVEREADPEAVQRMQRRGELVRVLGEGATARAVMAVMICPITMKNSARVPQSLSDRGVRVATSAHISGPARIDAAQAVRNEPHARKRSPAKRIGM